LVSETAVLGLVLLPVVNLCDLLSSLVLYAYMMLVCLHFLIFGPPYIGDCFNCFTVLHYCCELINFWSSKLAKPSNSKPQILQLLTVAAGQFVMKVPKCL